MKMKLVLTAIFSIFLTVAAVSAQQKTAANFAGKWELDASKSKLGDRMRIESMTMTVSQTDKELKVESTSKRAARPEGSGNGGGTNRGGFGGEGTQTATYALDGKETKIQQETPRGQIPVSLKAAWEKDGKLKLSSSRTFDSPSGSMTTTVKETWSLSPDGKILTVVREQETPRGNFSTELVFNKK